MQEYSNPVAPILTHSSISSWLNNSRLLPDGETKPIPEKLEAKSEIPGPVLSNAIKGVVVDLVSLSFSFGVFLQRKSNAENSSKAL